nr:HAD-IA family hydrolase [Sulfitobacter algicola]
MIIFDVDGTLVDSQNDIVSSMKAAFESVDIAVPDRSQILSIVGLSLPVAIAQLSPQTNDATQAEIVAAYKNAYAEQRAENDIAVTSPFYPGARDMLHQLNAKANILMGIATGKSRRGLDALLTGHGLNGIFVTEQVADFHPSKPHPSMIEAALSETGLAPDQAVMVGDTSFDMEMGRNAGIRTIGVSWGYHSRDNLGHAGADLIIDRYDALPDALDHIWEK